MVLTAPKVQFQESDGVIRRVSHSRVVEKAPRPKTAIDDDEHGQKRLKLGREKWRSVASSAVIIGFVVLVAAALVPNSATSAKLEPMFWPSIRVTGSGQNWGVFSPEPLQTEVRLFAVVYFEDGSSSHWEPPTDNVFDSSRAERWRKWESRVRKDRSSAHWPIASQYIANEFADDSRAVARVRLIRSWTQIPRPPEPNSDRQVNQYQFYEWDNLSSTGSELTQDDQQPIEYSS